MGLQGGPGDKGGCQVLREMEALPEAGEGQGPGAHLTLMYLNHGRK